MGFGVTEFDDKFAASFREKRLPRFGELIVYRSHTAPGAGPREIMVIVKRNPPELVNGLNGEPFCSMEIEALNHEIDGIASNEVDTGLDTIDVAVRNGEELTNRKIVKIIKDVGGVLVLGIA